ncbi:MAG: ECF transporter S component [Bacillaceae bacterium]|nr:ECF transporter S component [Bacillaceae bacterium]
MKQSSKLVKLIVLSLLSTISMILMLLDFPLPFLPSYLKVDFSDIPAIVAAFIFSPIAGVLVEGLKNALYFLYSGSGDPIGVTANFIAGSMFVLPVAMLYHKFRTVKSVMSGLIASTIVMALGMSVLNYFIILPAYSWFMGWETMSPAVKLTTILAGILPFNAIKGILIAVLFIPLFIKLKPWLEQKRLSFSN